MKRILFPTDFSLSAHQAFQYAIKLAKVVGAKIDVISVYPEALKGEEIYLGATEQRLLRKKKQKEMEERMEAFLKIYDSKSIGSKVVYPSDFVADSIVRQSKGNYDLIVMGTKGERNALDKLIGSVTTDTMTNARCPVLAIPEDAKFEGIKQITYATSFSANDKHFVKQLTDFAKAVGAEMQFLHVATKSKERETVQKGISMMEFGQFHIVNNPSVTAGVDEFLEESPSDILALFIPKRTLWQQLFHKSLSKKMAFHTATPLFVFHE